MVRPEVRLDNLLILLTLLGSIGAGIYEAGALRASLADSVDKESAIRAGETRALADQIVTQGKATADQIAALQQTLADVRADVRELRSYMMVPMVKEGRR